MKSNLALVCALGAVFVAGCFEEGSSAHRSITRSWPREGIERLELSSVHGAIEIRGVDRNEIKLVAEGHFSGAAGAAIARDGFLKAKTSGGVLRIEEKFTDERRRFVRVFGHSNRRHIEYSLEVPRDLLLSITNVSGEIQAEGVLAPMQLQTVNGSIEVTTEGAPLVATTVNGPIEARFTDRFAGAKFQTVNGPVEVIVPASASFVANISQLTGGFESNIPVEVKRRGGKFSAVVGPGKTSPFELHVNTVNGDVSLIREGDDAQPVELEPADPPDVGTETEPPAAPAPPPPPPSS